MGIVDFIVGTDIVLMGFECDRSETEHLGRGEMKYHGAALSGVHGVTHGFPCFPLFRGVATRSGGVLWLQADLS